METLPEFSITVQNRDDLLSMGVEKEFRHFRLHPAMRDWIIFRYADRYFQCVALPFGWGRSPLWFTRLMAPFVSELRSYGYRILPCMDDFLIIPSPYGIIASPQYCSRAPTQIDKLMRSLGLRRHPEQGKWKGSTLGQHLGVRVGTESMPFSSLPRKSGAISKACTGSIT